MSLCLRSQAGRSYDGQEGLSTLARGSVFQLCLTFAHQLQRFLKTSFFFLSQHKMLIALPSEMQVVLDACAQFSSFVVIIYSGSQAVFLKVASSLLSICQRRTQWGFTRTPILMAYILLHNYYIPSPNQQKTIWPTNEVINEVINDESYSA